MALPTLATRLIPVDGYADPVELSAAEIGAAQKIEESVGLPWIVDEATGDLYPGSGADPGIGRIDHPVAHVAIGHQATSGMEGVIIERSAFDGGGVALVGLRDVDPDDPPVRPVSGNAFVELNGSAVLVATGGLYIQVQSEVLEDHEVIAGPSTTLADGRHFSPILIGPEKVYQHSEEATDAADHDLLDLGEVEIVSLTLENAYAADMSTFSFQVYLENLGGKSTTFDVVLKRNGVEAQRYQRAYVGNGGSVSDSLTILAPLSIGDVVSLDVEAVSSKPQSQGWVMGTTQPTRITVSQG